MIGAILAKRGVAAGYEAMNRCDLAGIMADWHEDAVFTYPGDLPASGKFEGTEEGNAKHPSRGRRGSGQLA